MLVTLTTSTYKLQLNLATLDLGRAVSLEHAEVRPFAEAFGHGLCEVNATSHNDHINVGTVAMQKDIAHITANDIALQAETIGFLAYKVKDRKVYFRMGGKHSFRILDMGRPVGAIGYWLEAKKVSRVPVLNA
jgi:hypothetical protein